MFIDKKLIKYYIKSFILFYHAFYFWRKCDFYNLSSSVKYKVLFVMGAVKNKKQTKSNTVGAVFFLVFFFIWLEIRWKKNDSKYTSITNKLFYYMYRANREIL